MLNLFHSFIDWGGVFRSCGHSVAILKSCVTGPGTLRAKGVPQFDKGCAWVKRLQTSKRYQSRFSQQPDRAAFGF